MNIFELFIILVAGHFVCDYVFQTDAIANGKNNLLDPAKYGVNWQYWLTSHAATHGLAVGVITQNVFLGLFEFVSHWLIDYGKCNKFYGIHVDQSLHILCKVIIVIFYTLIPI